MFSVRLVSADSYQAQPLPQLDPSFSEFRGSEIKNVPILRIFGSTPTGEKTCLHIHGVFPYMYVPYTAEEDPASLSYRLAASLDAAINVSLGSATSNTQHVYSIQRVSGVPFYGYHKKEHQFLKIYFYNPTMIKRAADLLQNGSVLNQSLQPHEAHIPYILQFMMDYNLYGMNMINLSGVKYRREPTSLAELVASGRSENSENNEIDYLPSSVERQSTCQLEIDALAADILNRREIERGLDLNPGLAAIWDEERARRAQVGLQGGDSQLVNPKSPPRPAFRPTDNDIYQEQRLARRLLMISQCDESTLSTTTTPSVAYAAEVRDGENLLNSSSISVPSIQRTQHVQQENTMENMSLFDSPTIAESQKVSANCSVLDTEDMPLVDLLVELAGGDSVGNAVSVDTDSVLGSQVSLLLNDEKSDNDEDDIDDLNLTSLQLDSLSGLDNIENPVERRNHCENSLEDKSSLSTVHLSPFLTPNEAVSRPSGEEAIERNTEDSENHQIPQYDGAGDVSPTLVNSSSFSDDNGNNEDIDKNTKDFGHPSKCNNTSEVSSNSRKPDYSEQTNKISCCVHNATATNNPIDCPLACECEKSISERSTSPYERCVTDCTSQQSTLTSDEYLHQFGVINYESFDRLLEIDTDFIPDLEGMHSSMEIGILLSSGDSDSPESVRQDEENDNSIPLDAVLNGDPCFTESAELDKSDVTELRDQYASLLGNSLLPDVHTNPRIVDDFGSSSNYSDSDYQSNEKTCCVSINEPTPRSTAINCDSSSSSENVTPNIQEPESKSSAKGKLNANDGQEDCKIPRLPSDNSDYNCNFVATWAELQNIREDKRLYRLRNRRNGQRISASRQNRRKADKKSPPNITSQLFDRVPEDMQMKLETDSHQSPRKVPLKSAAKNSAKKSTNVVSSLPTLFPAECNAVPKSTVTLLIAESVEEILSIDSLPSVSRVVEVTSEENNEDIPCPPLHTEASLEAFHRSIIGTDNPLSESEKIFAKGLYSSDAFLAPENLVEPEFPVFDELADSNATVVVEESDSRSVDILLGTSYYSSQRSEKNYSSCVGHRHCVFSAKGRRVVKDRVFTSDEIYVIEKRKQGGQRPLDKDICTRAECKLPFVTLKKIDYKADCRIAEMVEVSSNIGESPSNDSSFCSTLISADTDESSIQQNSEEDKSVATIKSTNIPDCSTKRKPRGRRKRVILDSSANDDSSITSQIGSSSDNEPRNFDSSDWAENEGREIVSKIRNNFRDPYYTRRNKKLSLKTKRNYFQRKYSKTASRVPKKCYSLPGIPGVMEFPKKRGRPKKNVLTPHNDDSGERTKDELLKQNKPMHSVLFPNWGDKNEILESPSKGTTKIIQNNLIANKCELSSDKRKGKTLKSGCLSVAELSERQNNDSSDTVENLSPILIDHSSAATEMKGNGEKKVNETTTPKQLPENEALNSMIREVKCRSTRAKLKLLMETRQRSKAIVCKTDEEKPSETKGADPKDYSVPSISAMLTIAEINLPTVPKSPKAKKIENLNVEKELVIGEREDAKEIKPAADYDRISVDAIEKIDDSERNKNCDPAIVEAVEILTGEFDGSALSVIFDASIGDETSIDTYARDSEISEKVVTIMNNRDESSNDLKQMSYRSDRYAMNEQNFFTTSNNYTIDAVSLEMPTCLFEEDSNSAEQHMPKQLRDDRSLSHEDNCSNLKDNASLISVDPRDLEVCDVESLTSTCSLVSRIADVDPYESLLNDLELSCSTVMESSATSESPMFPMKMNYSFSGKTREGQRPPTLTQLGETDNSMFEEDSPIFEALSPEPRILEILDNSLKKQFNVNSQLGITDNAEKVNDESIIATDHFGDESQTEQRVAGKEESTQVEEETIAAISQYIARLSNARELPEVKEDGTSSVSIIEIENPLPPDVERYEEVVTTVESEADVHMNIANVEEASVIDEKNSKIRAEILSEIISSIETPDEPQPPLIALPITAPVDETSESITIGKTINSTSTPRDEGVVASGENEQMAIGAIIETEENHNAFECDMNDADETQKAQKFFMVDRNMNDTGVRDAETEQRILKNKEKISKERRSIATSDDRVSVNCRESYKCRPVTIKIVTLNSFGFSGYLSKSKGDDEKLEYSQENGENNEDNKSVKTVQLCDERESTPMLATNSPRKIAKTRKIPQRSQPTRMCVEKMKLEPKLSRANSSRELSTNLTLSEAFASSQNNFQESTSKRPESPVMDILEKESKTTISVSVKIDNENCAEFNAATEESTQREDDNDRSEKNQETDIDELQQNENRRETTDRISLVSELSTRKTGDENLEFLVRYNKIPNEKLAVTTATDMLCDVENVSTRRELSLSPQIEEEETMSAKNEREDATVALPKSDSTSSQIAKDNPAISKSKRRRRFGKSPKERIEMLDPEAESSEHKCDENIAVKKSPIEDNAVISSQGAKLLSQRFIKNNFESVTTKRVRIRKATAGENSEIIAGRASQETELSSQQVADDNSELKIVDKPKRRGRSGKASEAIAHISREQTTLSQQENCQSMAKNTTREPELSSRDIVDERFESITLSHIRLPSLECFSTPDESSKCVVERGYQRSEVSSRQCVAECHTAKASDTPRRRGHQQKNSLANEPILSAEYLWTQEENISEEIEPKSPVENGKLNRHRKNRIERIVSPSLEYPSSQEDESINEEIDPKSPVKYRKVGRPRKKQIKSIVDPSSEYPSSQDEENTIYPSSQEDESINEEIDLKNPVKYKKVGRRRKKQIATINDISSNYPSSQEEESIDVRHETKYREKLKRRGRLRSKTLLDTREQFSETPALEHRLDIEENDSKNSDQWSQENVVEDVEPMASDKLKGRGRKKASGMSPRDPLFEDSLSREQRDRNIAENGSQKIIVSSRKRIDDDVGPKSRIEFKRKARRRHSAAMISQTQSPEILSLQESAVNPTRESKLLGPSEFPSQKIVDENIEPKTHENRERKTRLRKIQVVNNHKSSTGSPSSREERRKKITVKKTPEPMISLKTNANDTVEANTLRISKKRFRFAKNLEGNVQKYSPSSLTTEDNLPEVTTKLTLRSSPLNSEKSLTKNDSPVIERLSLKNTKINIKPKSLFKHKKRVCFDEESIARCAAALKSYEVSPRDAIEHSSPKKPHKLSLKPQRFGNPTKTKIFLRENNKKSISSSETKNPSNPPSIIASPGASMIQDRPESTTNGVQFVKKTNGVKQNEKSKSNFGNNASLDLSSLQIPSRKPDQSHPIPYACNETSLTRELIYRDENLLVMNLRWMAPRNTKLTKQMEYLKEMNLHSVNLRRWEWKRTTSCRQLKIPKVYLKRLSRDSLLTYGIKLKSKSNDIVKKLKKSCAIDGFQLPAYDGAADLTSSDSEEEADVTIAREEKRVCIYQSAKKSVGSTRESIFTPRKRKLDAEDSEVAGPSCKRSTALEASKKSPYRSPNRTSMLKSPGRFSGYYSPLPIIVTSPKVRKETSEPLINIRDANVASTSCVTPRRKQQCLRESVMRGRISATKSSRSELGEKHNVAATMGSERSGELDGIGHEERETIDTKNPAPTISSERTDAAEIREVTTPRDSKDVRKKLVFPTTAENKCVETSSDSADETSKKEIEKLNISNVRSENFTTINEGEESIELSESLVNLNSTMSRATPGSSQCDNTSHPMIRDPYEVTTDEDSENDDDACNITFSQYIDSQISKNRTSMDRNQTNTEFSDERIVIRPKFNPPSRRNIVESMELYGIPKHRNQEPFFSVETDVPKQKEIAHKILKVPGKGFKDIPAFVPSVEGVTGIARWRKMKINEFNPSLAKSKDIDIKIALSGNEMVVLTPLAKPPTQKEVKDWLRVREYLAKKKKQEERESKKKKIHEEKIVGIQAAKMEEEEKRLSNSTDSKVVVPSTEIIDENNEREKESSRALKMRLAKKGSFKNIQESTASKSRRGSEEDIKIDSQRATEFDDTRRGSGDSNSTEIDPSLLSALGKSRLFREQEASKNLGVSYGQIEFLSDSTRSNVANENLQNAKALTRYQYLTIMSLEVHVTTRGDLLPDAQYDAIAAIFYSVQSDVPPTSNIKPLEHGVIVVADTEKAKNKMHYSYATNIPWTVYIAKDEEALLNSLVNLITRIDPEILIGWELETLSWGYVFQRAASLGINLYKRISRIPATQGKWEAQPRDIETLAEVKLPGRIVLDIWRLMRHEAALLSYTFESVMHHVLNERISCPSFKTLTDWWNMENPRPTRWRVTEHYSIRVLGIFRLLDQLDIIGRTSELARLFGIQFFEVFSRGSQYRVESVMLRLAKPLNYIAVSPSPMQRASMRAMEALPLIMEPESMFYSDPLIVLDFQSLYPSIIIAHNYCFSTCLGRIEHIGQPQPFEFGAYTLRVPKSTSLKLQGKLNFAPCGVAFVKPEVRLGILPRMLTEILETRFMVKKAMKDHNRDDKTLQRALHSRQMGLKFLANVTYGYTAANFSGRMPCIEVGDSVISKSKETLERAIKLVESTPHWGARVVYGDTDSLFILVPGKSKADAFVIGNEIADAVTAANPPPIKLKFEKVMYPAILQTKKRYCGYMYETPEQEKPTYLAKGIETVRRDGCPAVSKILEKTLKILFETKDVSLVKKYVTRQLDKVLRGKVSIQDLTFAKEFRGLKGYKAKACVPALELTKRLMKKDPRAVPRHNERVRYVIVAGAPNQALIHCVKTPWELINDPGLRPNAIYYVTRVIIPPLNRCLNLMGVDVNAWYRDMPHRHILDNPVGQPADKQKSTIFQYFGTIVCAACGQSSNKGICADCIANPVDTVVILHDKLRRLDRQSSLVTAICQSCIGRADVADCASLDCPVMYRRAQTQRELTQASHLRNIIECGNNLEL